MRGENIGTRTVDGVVNEDRSAEDRGSVDETIIAAIERVIAIVSAAKDCPKADSG
jgi:hypothetical protein